MSHINHFIVHTSHYRNIVFRDDIFLCNVGRRPMSRQEIWSPPYVDISGTRRAAKVLLSRHWIISFMCRFCFVCIALVHPTLQSRTQHQVEHQQTRCSSGIYPCAFCTIRFIYLIQRFFI